MEMNETIVFQQIIPPATMIPACGLLLLSSTARMNTVLARIRAFHSERLNVWQMDTSPNTKGAAVRDLRLEGLEFQTHRLLIRARLLRITMLQLFVAITCNALSVIGLAAGFVFEDSFGALHNAAAGVFIAGILLILGAMATSIAEVARITETIHYEHERVEAICESDCCDNADAGSLSSGSGEGTGL